jgi:hypothetical protein
MLVRSEAEWIERFDAVTSPHRRKVYLILGAVYLLAILGLTAVWAMGVVGGGAWMAFMAVFVYLTLFFAIAVPAIWYYDVIGRANGSTPGLYERGVQQNFHAFIPYSEVESARRTTVGKGQVEVMAMTPKYERREGLMSSLHPWTLDVNFLGEDGVRELETRVRATNPSQA